MDAPIFTIQKLAGRIKILLVMPDLEGGGAERSLVTVLSMLDYDRYEVDLKLFKKSGIFVDQVPSQVNILDEEPLAGAFSKGVPEGRRRLGAMGRGALVRWLLLRAVGKRVGFGRVEGRLWKMARREIKPLRKKYDVCVAFLEEFPMYYMVDCVDAARKVSFLHINYKEARLNARFDKPYYARCDKIVVVSEDSAATFRRVFPEFSDKLAMFDNIVPVEQIRERGREALEWPADMPRILTVGRIERQKGYDIGLEAIRLLKEDFRWYILGEGSQRARLERRVRKYGLEEKVVFLGLDSNPYRYMARCDLYFQPSRWEGKPIATREAVCFAHPMVVSDIEPFKEIFATHKGALTASLEPRAMAEALSRVLDDKALSSELAEQNRLLAEEIEAQGIDNFYRVIL